MTKLTKLLSLIIIALTVALFFKSCKKEKDYKALYNFEKQRFNNLKNKKGETIYVQKVIESKDQKLINQLSNEIFSLKAKTKTLVITKQIFTKVHDTINYTSVVPQYEDCFPITFEKNDSFFKIKGNVQSFGLVIDTLKIKNKISFRVTKQNEVQVINSNPLIQLEGLNSITLKKPKNKRFGIGAYIGYDAITRQPSLGVALSFNIFKF